jgi:hypothetical protein
MNNLIDRGLIESKGRLDAPGRPMLYGTTSDFLRAFGLTSIDALPQTADEIKAMFARMDGIEEEGDVVENEQLTISLDELSVSEGNTEESATKAEAEATPENDYENEHSAEDDIIIDD